MPCASPLWWAILGRAAGGPAAGAWRRRQRRSIASRPSQWIRISRPSSLLAWKGAWTIEPSAVDGGHVCGGLPRTAASAGAVAVAIAPQAAAGDRRLVGPMAGPVLATWRNRARRAALAERLQRADVGWAIWHRCWRCSKIQPARDCRTHGRRTRPRRACAESIAELAQIAGGATQRRSRSGACRPGDRGRIRARRAGRRTRRGGAGLTVQLAMAKQARQFRPRPPSAQPRQHSLVWLQGLLCGAMATLATPTALLLGVLLGPALLAILLDHEPGRPRARSIALCSLAAAIDPLRTLWTAGHTMATATALLSKSAWWQWRGVLPRRAGCWREIMPLAVRAALDGAEASPRASRLNAERARLMRDLGPRCAPGRSVIDRLAPA